ncbi:reverse transcriptase domain, reverse transcriptase zinc-binding domain protein [Tanacetum coccineum]
MENVNKNNVPLKGCLKASMIRNIEGKTIGKDGKPLCPVHKDVRVLSTHDENPNMEGDKAINLGGGSARVVIHIVAVEEVSAQFTNTLYGYFIRKRLAFPLVENYVKNTWAKFGLKRVMLDDEFFLFQFETKEGMDKIENAPVWVKLHHVPIVAYLEVGLSLITTQIGRHIMLDSYTSSMCLRSWGRTEYARALIEISAEEKLMESMVIAIPLSNGKGHSFATIEMEYEWTPLRCATCKIFDHTNEKCPKLPKEDVLMNVVSNGFTKVKKKKNKPKHVKHVEGVRLSKLKPNFYYHRVEHGESSWPNDKDIHPEVTKTNVNTSVGVPKPSSTNVKNSFSLLSEDEIKDTNWDLNDKLKKSSTILNKSDNEEVEEMVFEGPNGRQTLKTELEEASTPIDEDWTTNGKFYSKGTRIILGWNKYDVDVTVIAQYDQVIDDADAEVTFIDETSNDARNKNNKISNNN